LKDKWRTVGGLVQEMSLRGEKKTSGELICWPRLSWGERAVKKMKKGSKKDEPANVEKKRREERVDEWAKRCEK